MLASPGNQWTGVIGGPHKSFEALAQQAGDVSKLIVHFVDGLRDFGKLGAPKLHGPALTYDDVQFAQTLSRAEVEDFTGKKVLYYDEDFDYTAAVKADMVDDHNEVEVQGAVNLPMALQCGLCGVDVAEDMKTVFEELADIPFNECDDGCNKKVASKSTSSRSLAPA